MEQTSDATPSDSTWKRRTPGTARNPFSLLAIDGSAEDESDDEEWPRNGASMLDALESELTELKEAGILVPPDPQEALQQAVRELVRGHAAANRALGQWC